MLMDPEEIPEDPDPEDPEAPVEDADDEADQDGEAGKFDLIRAVEEIEKLAPDARAAKLAEYEPEQQEALLEAGVNLPATIQVEDDPPPVVSPNHPQYAEAIRRAKTDTAQGLSWSKHTDITTELRERIEDEVSIINAHPDTHPEYGAALQRLAHVLNSAQEAAAEAMPFGRVVSTREKTTPTGDVVVIEKNIRGQAREASRRTPADIEAIREQAEANTAAAAPPPESASQAELKEWYESEPDPRADRWRLLSRAQKDLLLSMEPQG